MPACLHAKVLSQYLPLEAPQPQQLFVNFHHCSLLMWSTYIVHCAVWDFHRLRSVMACTCIASSEMVEQPLTSLLRTYKDGCMGEWPDSLALSYA